MSNYLAIATVTAALGEVLQGALDEAVPGATVSFGRPETADNDLQQTPGVNIFLFQTTPNAAQRNIDVPTRDARGRLVNCPTLALDLHYLLTASGSYADFEPERILGAVTRVLHAQPYLPRPVIEKVIQDNPATLGSSNLASARELVTFTPTPLNLEELSKLWSVFFQTPYALSAAFRGTVVLIESEEQPYPVLPVRSRRIYAATLDQPVIRTVEAAEGPLAPIVWGGTLAILGRGLSRAGLALRFDDRVVTPEESRVRDTRITVVLEAASFGGQSLPAGLHTVRAERPLGNGAPAHLLRESRSVPFALQPTLTLAAGAVQTAAPPVDNRHTGTIAVDFAPPVVAGQRIELLLNEQGVADAEAHVLEPQPVPPANFPLTTLTFDFAAVRAGSYLVRARVDGVESAAEVDDVPGSATFGEITGPLAAIP